uniref:Large ribosomal subunit protein mL43 n=1 Tax=Heterorhabditis bacteriophora TaxID=37862 RepID=A0A1I7WCD5_HETBA
MLPKDQSSTFVVSQSNTVSNMQFFILTYGFSQTTNPTLQKPAKALNFGWRFTDFLKTPAYNGVSRFTPQLHRITFRFCKQSESSVGIRNFIEHRIIDIGELPLYIVYITSCNTSRWNKYHPKCTQQGYTNETPSVVVYTQPVRNTNPVIRAEYGNGRVLQLNARNMSMAEIEKDVHLLYSRSGEPVVKLESRQSAAVGSVQVDTTDFP